MAKFHHPLPREDTEHMGAGAGGALDKAGTKFLRALLPSPVCEGGYSSCPGSRMSGRRCEQRNASRLVWREDVSSGSVGVGLRLDS